MILLKKKKPIFSLLLIVVMLTTQLAVAVTPPTGNLSDQDGKIIIYRNQVKYYFGPSYAGRVSSTGNMNFQAWGSIKIHVNVFDIDYTNNMVLYLDGVKIATFPANNNNEYIATSVTLDTTYDSKEHTIEVRSQRTGDWVNVYDIQVTQQESYIYSEDLNKHLMGPTNYGRIIQTPVQSIEANGLIAVTVHFYDMDISNNLAVIVNNVQWALLNPTIDGVFKKDGHWTLSVVLDLGSVWEDYSIAIKLINSGDWINIYSIQIIDVLQEPIIYAMIDTVTVDLDDMHYWKDSRKVDVTISEGAGAFRMNVDRVYQDKNGDFISELVHTDFVVGGSEIYFFDDMDFTGEYYYHAYDLDNEVNSVSSAHKEAYKRWAFFVHGYRGSPDAFTGGNGGDEVNYFQNTIDTGIYDVVENVDLYGDSDNPTFISIGQNSDDDNQPDSLAERLRLLIENLHTGQYYYDLYNLTAFPNYHVKVDMIAHSMGGIVVRSMLQYENTASDLLIQISVEGSRKAELESVVFMASPHDGIHMDIFIDTQSMQLKHGSSFLDNLPTSLDSSVDVYVIFGVDSRNALPSYMFPAILDHPVDEPWDGLVWSSSATAIGEITEKWSIGEAHSPIVSSTEGFEILSKIMSRTLGTTIETVEITISVERHYSIGIIFVGNQILYDGSSESENTLHVGYSEFALYLGISLNKQYWLYNHVLKTKISDTITGVGTIIWIYTDVFSHMFTITITKI